MRLCFPWLTGHDAVQLLQSGLPTLALNVGLHSLPPPALSPISYRRASNCPAIDVPLRPILHLFNLLHLSAHLHPSTRTQYPQASPASKNSRIAEPIPARKTVLTGQRRHILQPSPPFSSQPLPSLTSRRLHYRLRNLQQHRRIPHSPSSAEEGVKATLRPQRTASESSARLRFTPTLGNYPRQYEYWPWKEENRHLRQAIQAC